QIINIRRLLDKIEIVLNRHIIQSTDFLDPYEIQVSIFVLNQFDNIAYCIFGGLEDSERKIIIIYPHYYILGEEDIELNYLMIYDYISGFSHRDFLGTVLGLGINREKIGDILIHEDYTQIIVKKEISDFILISLKKIGRENVKIKEIKRKDLVPVKLEYREITTTASSLRLDNIISSALNLSRKESQRLIDLNFVKVNWESINRFHREIEDGDMVSVRGYGRFIVELLGKTRKDRYRINIKLIK
ncbi:MAG: RNA-binding protein, partial [Tissierellia bacterium]|nr:RNA-binding protein [Tissierellia bacterium]